MGLKFSIVTCTWNSMAYLQQSIDSVLQQRYDNYEHIFVDGGSTDGTLELIASLKRPVTVLNDVRGGIARAMNAGIAAATGDVVAHMHSDDLYIGEDVFSRVSSELERSGAQWLIGKVHRVDDRGQVMPEIHSPPPYSYAKEIRRNYIPHAATFVRRKVFQELGSFDESYKLAMDYEMWLRIGKHHDPVQIDEYLAGFRIHPGSATRANATRSFEEDCRARLQHASALQLPEFWLRHAVRRWRRRDAA